MCQVVAYNRFKTIAKITTSLEKVAAFAYERFQLYGFDWEKFGVLDRWSLMGGGRLREVVTHRSWTV